MAERNLLWAHVACHVERTSHMYKKRHANIQPSCSSKFPRSPLPNSCRYGAYSPTPAVPLGHSRCIECLARNIDHYFRVNVATLQPVTGSSVQKLLNDYQIMFLQETWLAKQQLDNLSCLGVSHFAFGRADYDFNDGLVLGRGHGGTAGDRSKQTCS